MSYRGERTRKLNGERLGWKLMRRTSTSEIDWKREANYEKGEEREMRKVSVNWAKTVIQNRWDAIWNGV